MTKEKLRRSFFAHIEHKADEVWKSIDDLKKVMEMVPTAERSGPKCDTDEQIFKRFLELMKRFADIRHQFQLGLAAIDESRESTKHDTVSVYVTPNARTERTGGASIRQDDRLERAA